MRAWTQQRPLNIWTQPDWAQHCHPAFGHSSSQLAYLTHGMPQPTIAFSKTVRPWASPQWAAVLEAAAALSRVRMPHWGGRTRSPSEQRECPPLPVHTPAILPQTVDSFVFCSLPVCLFYLCVSLSTVQLTIARSQRMTWDWAMSYSAKALFEWLVWIICRRLPVLLASHLHNQCLVEMLHLVGIT